jgi:Fe2+ transport system protein FeoA
MKSLNHLKKSQSAIIKSIDINNCKTQNMILANQIKNRLIEMGIIEGAFVTLLHTGFGGEPLAIRLNNYNTMLSLGKLEASLIKIEE